MALNIACPEEYDVFVGLNPLGIGEGFELWWDDKVKGEIVS